MSFFGVLSSASESPHAVSGSINTAESRQQSAILAYIFIKSIPFFPLRLNANTF